MNIVIAAKLMELYAACPRCGCKVIGNEGSLECDTAAGYFKRSCGCGWHVEVTEVITESSMTEFPAEPSRQAGNGGKNAERKLEPRLENLERIHQAEKDESERQNIGRMPLSAQHERQKPD